MRAGWSLFPLPSFQIYISRFGVWLICSFLHPLTGKREQGWDPGPSELDLEEGSSERMDILDHCPTTASLLKIPLLMLVNMPKDRMQLEVNIFEVIHQPPLPWSQDPLFLLIYSFIHGQCFQHRIPLDERDRQTEVTARRQLMMGGYQGHMGKWPLKIPQSPEGWRAIWKGRWLMSNSKLFLLAL